METRYKTYKTLVEAERKVDRKKDIIIEVHGGKWLEFKIIKKQKKGE